MKIETDKLNISVWLAKLPPFLAEKILELPSEHTIGEIWITPATSDSPAQIKFKLESDFIIQGLPQDYTLTFTEKKEKLFVLKEDVDDIKVEGYVNKEMFVTPVQNESYFNFVRERAEKKRNKASTKIISYITEGKQSEKFGSVGELEFLARKRKKLLQSKKRERLERGEVIDILFKAFEKSAVWTARDLADFSGQPVAYIQEMLPEICVMSKKDYKNAYELKPEYKLNEK